MYKGGAEYRRVYNAREAVYKIEYKTWEELHIKMHNLREAVYKSVFSNDE